MDIFRIWLNKKLKPLNLDEAVFGDYITGILDGDDTKEEKQEALEGILGEMKDHSAEIIAKWNELTPKADEEKKEAKIKNIDIVKDMANILEKKLTTTCEVNRQYTEEELNIRQKILQYSQTEVHEFEEETTCELDENLIKNTNALDVQLANKARREQAKVDVQKKKDKDKEDREKQKQLKEEKKEKRKTVKGERKR